MRLSETPTLSIIQADAIDFLKAQPADSLDLVFGSPPYEQARLYLEAGANLGVSRKTDAWVRWMVEVWIEAQRACRGLVAFVVAGQTKNYRWSAGPALLMAELHGAGLNLRNPPIFSRVGIPGSGGPDWLRGDYEWIISTTRPGKLPWSDNTAGGHPPKWAPGGEMSHRLTDGERKNQWGGSHKVSGKNVRGEQDNKGHRPSHKLRTKGGSPKDSCRKGWATAGHANGDTPNGEDYDPPKLANPGNIIHLNVGGGVMGNALCHENEAPFPEKLAEFFILSFCPPRGVVSDCFSGSGTVAAMAKRHGRSFTGCDLRPSQVQLGLKRLAQESQLLFTGGENAAL